MPSQIARGVMYAERTTGDLPTGQRLAASSRRYFSSHAGTSQNTPTYYNFKLNCYYSPLSERKCRRPVPLEVARGRIGQQMSAVLRANALIISSGGE